MMDRRQILKQRLDDLREVLHSGETKVKHGDRYVEYNSPDEIRRVISDIQAELNQAKGANRSAFTLAHDTGL